MELKKCESCLNDIPLPVYNKSTAHKEYRERKFCSQGCANRQNNPLPSISKPCKHCNGAIPRTAKNRTYYKVLLYCSKECRRALTRERRPYVQCEICAVRVQADSNLLSRRFCSHRCYWVSLRMVGPRKISMPRQSLPRLPSRQCNQCGGTYEQGKTSQYNFSRSQFCSQKCMGDAQRDKGQTHYITQTVNGKKFKAHRVVASEILNRQLDRSEIVHHIDVNHRNNDPRNLMVCSDAVHKFIHNEMARRYIQERGGILPDDLLALGTWLGKL